MTNFYKFTQNPSCGMFDLSEEDKIGHFVFVEASDFRAANKKAEEIGLYFDGVDQDLDCDCCGDRWKAFSCEGIDVFDEKSVVKEIKMLKNNDPHAICTLIDAEIAEKDATNSSRSRRLLVETVFVLGLWFGLALLLSWIVG